MKIAASCLACLFFLMPFLATTTKASVLERVDLTKKDDFDPPNRIVHDHIDEPCGVHHTETTEQLIELSKKEAIRRQKKKEEDGDGAFIFDFFNWLLCLFLPSLCTPPPIVIDTYFHNPHQSDFLGYITTDEVLLMIAIANAQLEGTGISINALDFFRGPRDAWYNSIARSNEELEMLTAQKKGGPETLNIYLKRALGRDADGNLQSYCGYAYLAEAVEVVGILDGVTIAPGCHLDDKTTTHEIGHWLNLRHTFHPDCNGPGDMVSDTPAQSSFLGRIDGPCPFPPDSCPLQPGRDPINNMMDYAPNACLDLFSDGQVDRMREAWRLYRRDG